jgi:hypothetical protein
MATLRLKPRTKPAEGEINDATRTLERDKSGQDKAELRQLANARPNHPASLSEYLKTGH